MKKVFHKVAKQNPNVNKQASRQQSDPDIEKDLHGLSQLWSEQDKALRDENKPTSKEMSKFNSMKYLKSSELSQQKQNELIYPERRVEVHNFSV